MPNNGCPKSAAFGLSGHEKTCCALSIRDAVRYDDPVPISDVIRKTYICRLDLIPGNLELMEFEHETPAAIQRGAARASFARVRDALDSVEANYDVVISTAHRSLVF